jgi:flagellar M-ring protein FliF
MFDAAYWRAREGELSRTIVASPRIRAARVHIANPSADPFQPASEVTASVALRPASGGLAPGHAQALRYLVASSVPGLASENVTVIDADSGRVVGAEQTMTPGADAAGRASDLRESVERILAARVGPGNAVVQVSVELDTARETIVERRIDPESRVVVATESEARDNSSRDAAGGGVTVASNLPDGDAANGAEASTAQTSESREAVTFDMSETQREIAREPGTIRRISVAVLLNGIPEPDEDGQLRIVPRPDAELEALEALVRSAVGFDEARGDSVTVDSMAFDEAVVADLVAPGFLERIDLDLGQLLRTVVLALVALVIAFGLVRPAFRNVASTAEGAGDLALPDGLASDVNLPPLPETTDSTGPDPSMPAPVDFDAMPSFPQVALPDIDNAFGPGEMIEADPVTRLKRLIEEREEETVDILRSWMDEDEEGISR